MALIRKILRLKKNFLITFGFVFIFSIFITLFCLRRSIYFKYYSLFKIEQDYIFNKFKKNYQPLYVFKSECSCRKDELIVVKRSQNRAIYDIQNKLRSFSYKIDKNKLEEAIFTCDLYNVLRRGPNKKIISFSLYGTNNFYYQYLKALISLIKEFYPDWYVRIYFDSTINKTIVCDLECLSYKDGKNSSIYYDIVDFCNIEKMPIDLNVENTWNASYMHGMKWRWLPIGDSFVDFFSSRDTDAWMSPREVNSVNVWMKSNTLFHVMRDAPVHNIPIVGGYWGFSNIRNRHLADYLFKALTNEFIAHNYNSIKNEKGQDQFFLTDFYSRYSLKNSTTHDSFSCEQYGGDPFPTQRVGNCFVGCTYCCNSSAEIANQKYPYICPKECRPKNHQDWIHC